MDAAPGNGKHREVILADLGTEFTREIRRKYGVALPGPNRLPAINDVVFDQGENPMHIAADFLEAAPATPVRGLWHPGTLLMMTERRKAPTNDRNQ